MSWFVPPVLNYFQVCLVLHRLDSELAGIIARYQMTKNPCESVKSASSAVYSSEK